jgi:hydrogenase small subunit
MGAPVLDPGSRVARLAARGVSRRDFLAVCTIAAATVGLPSSALAALEKEVAGKARPPVVWLHFQECTGCTESLLRASHPALAEILLDLISLDYHETLFAGAGKQAEDALEKAIRESDGKLLLVVEGAIPTKDGGIYCKVGGRTAIEMLEHVAPHAAAVVAIGSCASFGGVAAAEPNPTGAVGVPRILRDRPVVTLPGCPANPYNLLGVVLQFATFGTLPALDGLGRPKFAYARTIHEDCPRRAHFDAGRFAEAFGDEGHRAGYCLYKLGCKGPETHANCSLLHFCDVLGAWPIGVGHPCVGCTEPEIAFRAPMHATADIARPVPPASYPGVRPDHGGAITPGGAAVAGAIGGALLGAGLVAERRLRRVEAMATGPGREGR